MNILRPISELNFQNHFRFLSSSPTDFLDTEPRILLREIMRRHAQTFFYHSQSDDETETEYSSDDSESLSENTEIENITPPMTPPALEELPPLFPEYLGNLMPSIPTMSMPTILSINEQFHPVDLSANFTEITNDEIINDEDNNDDESDIDLNNAVDPREFLFRNDPYDVHEGPVDLSTNISQIAMASSDDYEDEPDDIPDQHHEIEPENYAIAPDLFELPMVSYSPMLENDSPFRPYESTPKSYEPSQTQLFSEMDSAYVENVLPQNEYQEDVTTSTYCNISNPRVSIITPTWTETENAVDTELFQTICQVEANSNANQEYSIEDTIVAIDDIERRLPLPIKKRPLPNLDDESDNEELDAEVAIINGLPPKKRFRLD